MNHLAWQGHSQNRLIGVVPKTNRYKQRCQVHIARHLFIVIKTDITSRNRCAPKNRYARRLFIVIKPEIPCFLRSLLFQARLSSSCLRLSEGCNVKSPSSKSPRIFLPLENHYVSSQCIILIGSGDVQTTANHLK